MAAVLVFGATGGIGGAIAEGLAASGRPVHLAGRDAERLAALAARLGAPATVADVLAPGAIARAVAEAAGAHGGALSGLVFAVGSIVLKPLKRATVEDHLGAYRLNVVAAAEAVAAAEGALKAGQGAVVLFSSVAARSGFANHAVIGPAKAAVEGLTVALAAELAPAVRVNCIAPSLTRTGIAAPLTGNEAMAKAIAAQHPIPRLGEPEDVAALARFLLGPEAGWITGQVFAVDGGRSSLRTKG
jgi:NAD(P)-dependent dehydrogenase (short-subunit alcohol dehydrogenase family)